jgi:aspartyl protease family protein
MGKRLFWLLILPWMFAMQAGATELAVSGIVGKKAVLVIDDAAPRTVAVGQSTPEGVKVLEISGDTVVVEVDGHQERLRVGEHVVSREGSRNGRFYVNGRINGAPARFVVDTGATLVSMGQSDARRLGLDLTKARRGRIRTASGPSMVWLMKLDRVKVGRIELTNVDAAVHENDRPYMFLGMSFLRHMEMVYDGRYLRLREKGTEVDGRQERLRIGEHVVSREGSRNEEVRIKGDRKGRFYVNGHINGGSARFKVDTGATRVSMGRSDAHRLGLDLTKARRGSSQTASGPSRVWFVKLDRVKVGGIELVGVDAMVHENDLPHTLLGMSFLKHMEMVYDGDRYLRLREKSTE